jgi:aldose 1-epimerase
LPGTANGAVTLAAGDATVALAPGVGGAIASFRWRGRDVLRPTSDVAFAARDVRQFACYPLVPYSNRIAHATLTLGAVTHRLARNFGDHPHAMHGVGWQCGWAVEAHEPAQARLVLDHVPADERALAWPFAFRATQAFQLTSLPDGVMLTLTMTIRNSDQRAFPFGLGWHPFFPRDSATELGFAAESVWETDDMRLPMRKVALPPDWHFDPPRTIGTTTLDNVFTGWRGDAEIRWPQVRLRALVEADRACSHLVVFIPSDRDYFAVEPVTHMTDAFNRAARGERETGTRHLQPDEARSCTMRIVATTHDPVSR